MDRAGRGVLCRTLLRLNSRESKNTYLVCIVGISAVTWAGDRQNTRHTLYRFFS